MNAKFIFTIFDIAVGLMKNHASGKTAEVVAGVEDLKRLLQAGQAAVDAEAGQEIDESKA